MRTLLCSALVALCLSSAAFAKSADIILVIGVTPDCRVGLYQSWGNTATPELHAKIAAGMKIMRRYLGVTDLLDGLREGIEKAGGTIQIVTFDLDADDTCSSQTDAPAA